MIKLKDLLNEKITGGKVICDACNWEWYMSDGGKQPYLCHKCGNDNTPIKEVQSAAQQAAIAISKKESGKYNKSGKRIKETSDPESGKSAPYGSGYAPVDEEKNPRIPRKKGQKANSKKHSDLFTDENPKGTIHGLKFATVEDAEKSVSKIKSSGKPHAHKIQAAVAMEQRAKSAGKPTAAGVYRTYINSIKKS